ncbi:hypothetical protein Nepgr_020716 [Nepenthes gracilis]|uniref:Uncharacterized protein n=1 Tax=Nepenthes gracilis TaxID=150966 RepID=A0AAD3SVS4_NEPGR|nr:hypothetical protein Nepgr_020716 [Nepenthes gracilis]
MPLHEPEVLDVLLAYGDDPVMFPAVLALLPECGIDGLGRQLITSRTTELLENHKKATPKADIPVPVGRRPTSLRQLSMRQENENWHCIRWPNPWLRNQDEVITEPWNQLEPSGRLGQVQGAVAAEGGCGSAVRIPLMLPYEMDQVNINKSCVTRLSKGNGGANRGC